MVINDSGWRCADPVLKPSFRAAINYTLETVGYFGSNPSVAIGADGNPIISYHDASNGDLELYVCADAACTSGINRELVTAGDVGFYPSVAIGANGNPIISHMNGDLELYVCADAACTTGTNQTLEENGDVGYYTSVAIGADGNPIISHRDDNTNNDLELYVCADAACTSGTNRTLETGGDVGYFTSVAIGADGNPIISHRDDNTNNDLELYVCADAACTSGTNRTLETGGDVGYFTSVAIGADGNPIISHRDDNTNNDLELYVCADAACTSGTNRTLETGGDVGYFTSVAIGADGNPVISHFDGTNRDLELYVCEDAACTSGTNRTLETGGDVGRYTSVAIGAEGNPIISHRDNTNDDLELYVCADATCTTGTNQTLEENGDVGNYTSVAIGANGNPIISHLDWTNGDLKLYVGPATTYSIVFE